jgi:hypothetical protein
MCYGTGITFLLRGLPLIAIDLGPRFHLGRILITANAEASLAAEDLSAALRRHGRGDWGELCAAAAKQNEHSLLDGGRLVSVYHGRNCVQFYIITESDRNSTTILLPEDC